MAASHWLTTMKERLSPIWTAVAHQFERLKRWLIPLKSPIDWKAVRTQAAPWLVPQSILSLAFTIVVLIVLSATFIPWLWKLYSANLPAIIPLGAGIGGGVVAWAALAQAATARRRHEAQTQADLQRRITESLSKAAELLGSDKIPLRLGAIYTLERISRESRDDYWTIMRTLCAFVRERAPRKASVRPSSKTAPTTNKESENVEKPDEMSFDADLVYRLQKIADLGLPEPPTDVAAALTVISRRDSTTWRDFGDFRWGRDLRYTDLTGADLHEAWLPGVWFLGTELVGAYLTGADLTGATFVNAKAYDVTLNEADLTGANLSGADLGTSWLRSAKLKKARLNRATLKLTDLTGADLTGADLSDADLTGAKLNRAKLVGARLVGAKLGVHESMSRPTNLSGADLTGADLTGADLTGADLTGADLTGADLTGADLTGADLTGADLTGADLTGADLTGADLTGATLFGVKLTGADLIGVSGLSEEQLASAHGDAKVRLPNEMSYPAQWARSPQEEPRTKPDG
jgi:uncharacterized protein YjbI with pentapeptide repeats